MWSSPSVRVATSVTTVVAFAVLGSTAEAGIFSPIVWSSATNITGDNDVSTNGSLVYACNIGAPGVQNATVGGVTFNAFAWPTGNGPGASLAQVTFQESPGDLNSSNVLGAPSSLSSGYQGLLGSGGTATNPATITATLGGLTIGNTYELQVWSSNSSNGNGGIFVLFDRTTFASGGNQVILDANTTNTAGGLGQYVRGTFTAVSQEQTFTMDGTGGVPLINAFQLRDITASGVPGTGFAAIVGALLPGARRRRR